MQLDDVRRILSEAGFRIKDEKELGNKSGVQIKLEDGGIVNHFKTGKLSFQGTGSDKLEQVFSGGSPAAGGAASLSKKIFVVYGHDETAKTQLELMLRKWGFDPLILDQLPSEGQTIIEKLEKYSQDVGYAVVLATPDDEGHKANRPDEKTFRARQNVVLELGMLLSKLGRKKVAILLKDQANMEKPSDIQGLIYIPFKENLVKETQVVLAQEMVTQGYHIDVKKL
jgi:predicted nucleotide-binding protein